MPRSVIRNPDTFFKLRRRKNVLEYEQKRTAPKSMCVTKKISAKSPPPPLIENYWQANPTSTTEVIHYKKTPEYIRALANKECRVYDLGRLTGTAFQDTVLQFDNQYATHGDDQIVVEQDIGLAASSVVATFVNWIICRVTRKRFRVGKALNPFYRNVKTTFSILRNGVLPLFRDIKLSSNINQNHFGLISFGGALLVGSLYPFIRRYIFRSNESEKETLARTGLEGWSKYAKTALVWGLSCGQTVGWAVASAFNYSKSLSMSLGGEIAGTGLALASLIAVPLFNRLRCWWKGKEWAELNKNKKRDDFRNTYIRSGIVLGAAIGTVIGFFAFFGVGAPFGAAVGAAIGGTLCGVAGYFAGPHISKFMKRKYNFKKTDNSWDYATRTTSNVGNSVGIIIGALIGLCVPIPGGVVAGALIGGAIGTLAGWSTGIGVVRYARKHYQPETPAKRLPWTLRIDSEAFKFALAGMFIGLAIGFLCGGLVGAGIGFTLGSAIGTVIGAMRGATKEKWPEKKAPEEIALTETLLSEPTEKRNHLQHELRIDTQLAKRYSHKIIQTQSTEEFSTTENAKPSTNSNSTDAPVAPLSGNNTPYNYVPGSLSAGFFADKKKNKISVPTGSAKPDFSPRAA